MHRRPTFVFNEALCVVVFSSLSWYSTGAMMKHVYVDPQQRYFVPTEGLYEPTYSCVWNGLYCDENTTTAATKCGVGELKEVRVMFGVC